MPTKIIGSRKKNKISPRIKIIRFGVFVNHFPANFFGGNLSDKKRGGMVVKKDVATGGIG